MKKTATMCLIFLIALSIYAASRPQKEIKVSPEQKFKLSLNVKHINGKYSISSDSTLLTITDSFSYIVKKGKTTYTTNRNNSEAIQKMLGNAHEPSYLSYRVIAVIRDEFTPSEVDYLKYETYSEFPLIKIIAKDMIINYNENRANINSAYIINSRDNDTTLVEFSYEGNKVVKRHYKSKRAKNIVRY